MHYQLQDGGVQLSSFGKDFVGLKPTLEAEILVNNISLCKLFIGVKKINGHSGVNFSFNHRISFIIAQTISIFLTVLLQMPNEFFTIIALIWSAKNLPSTDCFYTLVTRFLLFRHVNWICAMFLQAGKTRIGKTCFFFKSACP